MAKQKKQKKKNSVILIGMMGAGKTHFGQSLAKKLGLEFVDLDSLLEQRSGLSIPQIFAAEGEAGFRRRETRILQEFCESTGKIVATGGGVVTTPQNREILKNNKAPVIFLKVSPTASYARTKGTDRPLLKTKDPLKTIGKLIEERTPWYEEVADAQFDSEAEEIVEEIIAWLDKCKK